MLIRPAKHEDIPGIIKLLFQVAEIHHKGRPDIFKSGCAKYTEKELEEIIDNINTPVFVACDENCIVGHAFCIITQTGCNGVLVDNKSLYIDDICVDSKCRGKHIGSALCKAVLDYAKSIQCYNVTLNVWCLNEDAMAFYKAMGFKEQKIVMETIIKP